MENIFLNKLKEQIIVFDGAMGTSIQKFNLTKNDYLGKEGCNEILNISRPEIIEKVHLSFLETGCDVIETNTFGANEVVLSEYDFQNRVYEINRKGAEIAKKAALKFSNSEKPRFVAGSVGPGTKLPSLGHIGFDELNDVFKKQIFGLIDGGVDIVIIETCQDLLQAKIAIIACLEVFEERKIKLPIVVQVTIEKAGTMLTGSDIETVITTLSRFDIDVLGINCATGPIEMETHLKKIFKYWNKAISMQANAGLPKLVNGKMKYPLGPDKFAAIVTKFVKKYNINIIGGCCGTTPKHIDAIVKNLKKEKLAKSNFTNRKISSQLIRSCSSLYNSQSFLVSPKPLIVGERMNPSGSKKFRNALLKTDYDEMVQMALDQEKNSSHVLDLCTGYTGVDEKDTMKNLVKRLNVETKVPIMIDSTNEDVLETALKCVAGKAIVNSVNLEDGGEKIRRVLSLCKKYGAAVIALTINENGMAKTEGEKVQIAKRMYEIIRSEFEIPEEDIFFDFLTFTLASGDKGYENSAIETLEALKKWKSLFPKTNTILGVSNVSFGLKPVIRKKINTVFLYHAIKKGLDAAILHAGKIAPLHELSVVERKLIDNLIFNKDKNALIDLISFYEKNVVKKKVLITKNVSVETKLVQMIINGDKKDLESVLKKALEKYSGLEVINKFLLKGMKKVGKLFGSGEMQLPFVLRSAETMKKAVSVLEPFMDKKEIVSKGSILIATVQGDVHDIGKNLVDIILSNNGYEVVNLGIRQSIGSIIQSYKKNPTTCIGLSGLLVQSVLVMKENLEVLNNMGITPPIILGGAALTKNFVEKELKPLYKGEVFYAEDAFEGMQIIDKVLKTSKTFSIKVEKKKHESSFTIKKTLAPPFWGTKTLSFSINDVVPYINKISLSILQWKLKKNPKQNFKEYQDFLNCFVEKKLDSLIKKANEEKLLDLKVVYGYFPCNSNDKNLLIYENQFSKTPFINFEFPRQDKSGNLCISDYFKPLSSGEKDLIAFSLVTVGDEASKFSKDLFERKRYEDYLYWHGFSVEMAEALAEYFHKYIREEIGVADKDSKSMKDIFAGKYQGCRYSFGYSACPDLKNQKKIFEILKPERIGVSLTENYQLVPEQSTSALISFNQHAKYFTV